MHYTGTAGASPITVTRGDRVAPPLPLRPPGPLPGLQPGRFLEPANHQVPLVGAFQIVVKTKLYTQHPHRNSTTLFRRPADGFHGEPLTLSMANSVGTVVADGPRYVWRLRTAPPRLAQSFEWTRPAFSFDRDPARPADGSVLRGSHSPVDRALNEAPLPLVLELQVLVVQTAPSHQDELSPIAPLHRVAAYLTRAEVSLGKEAVERATFGAREHDVVQPVGPVRGLEPEAGLGADPLKSLLRMASTTAF